MPHATAYAGKDFTINGHNFYVGLFRWPVQNDPESYFAALLMDKGGDQWETIIQLLPMPIASPAKGAQATMTDILTQFNAKIAEVAPANTSNDLAWIQRLKKLFDGLTVVDGKIVSTGL